MNEFDGTFEHYLEEWSTEHFPNVIVGYNFYEGDKSVGEPDLFEITVLRGKKDIWRFMSDVEQYEVETACKAHMKDDHDRI